MRQFLLQQCQFGAVEAVAFSGNLEIAYGLVKKWPLHDRACKSPKNSLPGSTPVTSKRSLARVHAT